MCPSLGICPVSHTTPTEDNIHPKGMDLLCEQSRCDVYLSKSALRVAAGRIQDGYSSLELAQVPRLC